MKIGDKVVLNSILMKEGIITCIKDGYATISNNVGCKLTIPIEDIPQ